VKFRRKADPVDAVDAAHDDTDLEVGADEVGGSVDGPIDAEDIDDDVERIDLGALLVAPVAGTELQLQVDEASGQVQSVLLAGPEGALELRVFAAPRHGDLWSEIRPRIASELAQRGGTATEREGRFGTELVCEIPVQLPDGQAATQASRIIGINGSRWLLRATILGRPATEPETGTELEDALVGVAVRRGDHAMPVGDPLSLTLPPEARRQGT
jgi:Protein of unknown function (DUF3710)